jgi:hypothetical protein
VGAITKVGILFAEPYNKPLSTGGQFQPGCYLVFTSGGAVVPVYRDPQLRWPHKQTSVPGYGPPSVYAVTSGVAADGTGKFAPIYLDPSIAYSYTLYSAAGVVLESATNITSSNLTQLTGVVTSAINSLGNGTTPVIDPTLQVALPNAGTYRVEANLSFADATGSGLGLHLGVYFSGALNSAADNALVIYGALNGGVQIIDGSININVPASFATVGSTSATNILSIAGTIQTSGSGVLSVDWSFLNAGNGILSLSSGSALYATRLA